MTEQLKMVSLKCGNCGGVLEIYGDMERFACGYCGSEQIVERRGGTVALRLVVDAVARVQVGTDKTAAELALARLDKELAAARARWQQADANFRSRNKSGWGPAVATMVFSAIIFFAALGSLVNGPDTGLLLLLWIAAGAGAIALFILAMNRNSDAQKSYSARRAELWNPHAEEIRRLELLIAKKRELVDS